MNELLSWGIGILGTITFAVVGYLLMENISLLKSLQLIVTEFRIEFSSHKQENVDTKRDVEDLKSRVGGLEETSIAHMIKFTEIETMFKVKKDV